MQNITMIMMSLFVVLLWGCSSVQQWPEPNNYSKPALKAVAYGSTAPNAHNTQPWRIKILSDTEFLVYSIHLLPETDPPARQIHISLGCFIELAKIGMSADGYETKVDYLPEGEFKIKVNEISSKPLAKISLIKKEGIKKDELFDFINFRASNGKVYEGEMITKDEFDKVVNHIDNKYCDMVFINNQDIMKPHLDIFSKAMEIETITNATSEETRKMFRFSDKERETKRDGLNIYTSGLSGIIAWIAEWQMDDGDSTTWHSESMIKTTLESIDKAIYSAKGIVYFKTKNNELLDWVKCGRDFVRFNIALAKYDLALSHYNQVIQEYPEMQKLQDDFEKLTNSNDKEKIQIIVRLGRAEKAAKSWRKNIEDVIIE